MLLGVNNKLKGEISGLEQRLEGCQAKGPDYEKIIEIICALKAEKMKKEKELRDYLNRGGRKKSVRITTYRDSVQYSQAERNLRQLEMDNRALRNKINFHNERIEK